MWRSCEARNEAIFGELISDITAVNVSAAGSGTNAVVYRGGDLIQSRRWSGGGLPIHIVLNNLIVGLGAELQIPAGEVIKVGTGLFITVRGDIFTEGTASQPVIFTSTRDDSAGGDSNGDDSTNSAAEGDWEAIYLENGANDSLLEYTQIRYAGNYHLPRNPGSEVPSLQFNGSTATARHVEVRNSDWYGVRVVSGKPTLEDVRVTGSRHHAFSMGLAAQPIQSNLSAFGNSFDDYQIDNGTTSADITLDVTTIPYSMIGDLSIPADKKLEIKKNVVLKLGNGQDINILGTLIARGTLVEPIIITSQMDDSVFGDTFHDGATAPQKGDWHQLLFTSTSTNSVLEHVDLRYGGNYYNPGNSFGLAGTLAVAGSSPTIRDSRILHADHAGVDLASGQPLLENVSVIDAL